MKLLLTIMLPVVAVLGLTACERTEVNGIGSVTGDAEFPPQLDLVSFAGCTQGGFGFVDGKGLIENHTPTPATYEVVVAFRDGETRLEQASAWVRDLGPGERAEFKATTLLGDRASRVSSCAVITINRL